MSRVMKLLRSFRDWLATRSLRSLVIYFVLQTLVLLALFIVFIWVLLTR